MRSLPALWEGLFRLALLISRGMWEKCRKVEEGMREVREYVKSEGKVGISVRSLPEELRNVVVNFVILGCWLKSLHSLSSPGPPRAYLKGKVFVKASRKGQDARRATLVLMPEGPYAGIHLTSLPPV